jgi:hypothetical protein
VTDVSSRSVAYERSDVPLPLLAGLGAGVAAFLILTPVLLMLFFPETAKVRTPVRIDSSIPNPRLQINPAADLRDLRKWEERRLSGYGWADRTQNVVRLPIERAIELAAERGLPGWPKPQAP